MDSRILCVCARTILAFLLETVEGWFKNLLFLQRFGYISRSDPLGAHCEYQLYHRRGFLVNKEMTFLSTVGVAAVTIWDRCSKAFTALGFCFEYSADFLACVAGIPLVEQILERRKLVVIAEQRVIVIVDGDIPDAVSREDKLGIVADLDIVSAESGQVFGDNDSDLARFNQLVHLLKAWTVKANA